MFYDGVLSLVAASSISEQLKRQEGVLNEKLRWVESLSSTTEPRPETEFMKPETSAVGDIITESHGQISGAINTPQSHGVMAGMGRVAGQVTLCCLFQSD